MLLRGEISKKKKSKLSAKEKEHRHVEDYTMFSVDWKDAVLDKEKLFSYLDNLPPELFRLKGFINLEEGTCYLSYVTGTHDITVFPEKKNTQLVFIGKSLKQDKLVSQLKKCIMQ